MRATSIEKEPSCLVHPTQQWKQVNRNTKFIGKGIAPSTSGLTSLLLITARERNGTLGTTSTPLHTHAKEAEVFKCIENVSKKLGTYDLTKTILETMSVVLAKFTCQ